MANKFWPATELTDGANSLAAISAAEIADGDAAFVVRDGIFSFYRMNVSSGAAHNPPDVVAPDNAGSADSRWIKLGAIGTEPVGFQPTDIAGCYGWFDFSDSTTLTIVDDGGTDKISLVTNKTESDRLVCHSPDAEVEANRPLYIESGINSMGCIGWPDSDTTYRILFGPAAEEMVSSDTEFSIFYIAKPMYGTSKWDARKSLDFKAAGGSFVSTTESWLGYFSTPDEYTVSPAFLDADHAHAVYEKTLVSGVVLASHHGTDAVGFYSYLSGSILDSTLTAPLGIPSFEHVLHIGSSVAAGNNARNLHIGEVLVFDSNLSQTDREKVEGYLAHKWGAEADLPAEHPYKDSAP